jgi:hypothetical protein
MFDLPDVLGIADHEQDIAGGKGQVGGRIGNDLGFAVDGQERNAVLLAHLGFLKRLGDGGRSLLDASLRPSEVSVPKIVMQGISPIEG